MIELFRIFGTIGLNGVDSVNSELDDVTGNAEHSAGKISGAIKKIGAAIATYFAVDKIKDFGVKIVQTAADVQAETAQFEAAFKDLAGTATEMFNRVSEATGVFATRLQVTGTKAYAQLKGAGLEANDALKQTEVFLNLATDAAAYYDISLEDAEARIRSFMRGNVEAGDAIGLFTSESQRNSYAVEMYGKKWIDLTEAQKQMLMLNVAQDIYDQAGATGQAAREADGLANITGNLKEVWRQFLAVVGQPVLEWVTPIIQNLTAKLTEMKGKVEELRQWVNENRDTIERWKNAIIAVTITLGSLWIAMQSGKVIMQMTTWIKGANAALSAYKVATAASANVSTLLASTLSAGQLIWGLLTGKITLATIATLLQAKAQALLNAVMTANPIGLIIAAVAALIAILVVLYKKNEDFRNAVNELWSEIKAGLQPAIEALKPLLSAIIDLVKSIWSLISTLVIPIIKLFAATLTERIKGILPILQVLLTVFNAVFQPIIKIVTTVIKIITGIATVMTKAVTAVSNGIGKIKKLFSFKWNLPKLKLPHLKIKGKFSLAPPSVPKFSIDWYKNGGILTQPTAFGVNPTTGALRVGGEAGDEAVAPIDTLLGYVKTAVQEETGGITYTLQRLIDMLATYFPQFIDLMEKDVVLDDDTLVGKIAPKMNVRLAELQTANVRGR